MILSRRADSQNITGREIIGAANPMPAAGCDYPSTYYYLYLRSQQRAVRVVLLCYGWISTLLPLAVFDLNHILKKQSHG